MASARASSRLPVAQATFAGASSTVDGCSSTDPCASRRGVSLRGAVVRRRCGPRSRSACVRRGRLGAPACRRAAQQCPRGPWVRASLVDRTVSIVVPSAPSPVVLVRPAPRFERRGGPPGRCGDGGSGWTVREPYGAAGPRYSAGSGSNIGFSGPEGFHCRLALVGPRSQVLGNTGISVRNREGAAERCFAPWPVMAGVLRKSSDRACVMPTWRGGVLLRQRRGGCRPRLSCDGTPGARRRNRR